MWELFLKAGDEGRQRVILHAVDAGNGQAAALCVIVKLQCLLVQKDNALRNVGKCLSGGCDYGVRLSLAALKQRDAQFLFQSGETLAEGGLREIVVVCGTGNSAAVPDVQEKLQGFNVHS